MIGIGPTLPTIYSNLLWSEEKLLLSFGSPDSSLCFRKLSFHSKLMERGVKTFASALQHLSSPALKLH